MLSQKAFRDKNILILGFGKSGQSSAKLLQKFAKNIFVFDKKFVVKKCSLQTQKKENIIFRNRKNFCENNNIFFENNLSKILKKNKINFCIVSPGFSVFSKEIYAIKKQKICLLSELELGAIFCKTKHIFAITGTNGKTTTVNAIHHIFRCAKKDCFLCGNVGTPITEIAQHTTKKSLVVCEVSSFQMEISHKHFCPFASAILNLQDDHIDRHKNTKNYFLCKEKIFSNNPKTICFANFDDNVSKKYFLKKNYKIKYFSIKNKKIYKNKLNLIKNNNLCGEYNLSNLMCACEIALCAKINPTTIKNAISTFFGLPHRLQVVAKHKHITFVNDSKATNVASTIFALDAISQKTILLVGGSDKNLNFSPLCKHNIFYVITFGETAKKIANAFDKNQKLEIANTLKSAFEIATKIAQNQVDETTILLSPSCASFDAFSSYEERGNYFKNLVQEFCNKN